MKKFNSREEIVEFMHDVCDEFGLKLTFKDDEEECAFFAGTIGDGEIFLGTYNNPELMLISFFHELAHCMEFDFHYIDITQMEKELHVTSEGLE